MPQMTKAKNQLVLHESVPTKTVPKRLRQAKAKQPGELDVHIERGRTALAKIRKAEEDAYEAELRAAGRPIYTPAEVSKLTGLDIVEGWSQRKMQDLVDLSTVMVPLIELRKKALDVTTKYVVPGRNAVKELMGEVYGLYLDLEASPKKLDAYREIKAVLKSEGVTTHRDTPSATLVVKSVFSGFDAKQAHLYSRSLEYAQSQKVAAEAYSTFVSEAGGYEKVRLIAAKSKPEYVKRVEDQTASSNVIAELLEFERRHPFLTVTGLSSDQRGRLAYSDYKKVVFVAQIEHDRMKVYAQVPLTPEMEQHIERAYFKGYGDSVENLKRVLLQRRKVAEANRTKYGDDWLTNGERFADEFLAAERKGVVTRPKKVNV